MTAVSAVVVSALLLVHLLARSTAYFSLIQSRNSMNGIMENKEDACQQIQIKDAIIGFQDTISPNTARQYAAHNWGISEWSYEQFREKMADARRKFV